MTRIKTMHCFKCNAEFEHDVVLDEVETEIEFDCGYFRTEYTVCPVCGNVEELDYYECEWDELTDDERDYMKFSGYSPWQLAEEERFNMEFNDGRDEYWEDF